MSHNLELLKNSKKLGEFQSLPEFALVKVDFQEEPILLKNYNQSIIFDVYEVNEKELEDLNKYYGFISIHNINNIHHREKIETPFGDAYVFTNNRKLKHVNLIESGDWVDFHSYQSILRIPEIQLKEKQN